MQTPIDFAFSDSVKAVQSRKGSRETYEKMSARGGWSAELTDDIREFIGQQRSFYLGTVSADGQPYIQHRGGPPGFLKVLDDRTLAFADFKGNRQFISQGNLDDNPKAFIFLMDYSIPQRLKLWGEARVVEDDDELIDSLMPDNYRARAEQAIVFTINLWDLNCRQHIPQRFEAEDVARAIEDRDRKIEALETELQRLRADAD